MKKVLNSLAGLLLLAFLSVPVFAGTAQFRTNHTADWIVYGLSAIGIVGTVTITYKFQLPASAALTSGITAPTAVQALAISAFGVIVFMSDTEISGTITHNWKLSTNAQALLCPWINWYWTTYGTAGISFALTDSSTVTITKLSGTGAGGTFNVLIQKPNSILYPSTS